MLRYQAPRMADNLAAWTTVANCLLLLAPYLCFGQSKTQNDPSQCPLVPQDSFTLDQVLVSVTPQGCLRQLVGDDVAPCFYRQSWFWDGSKHRECSGVSDYSYATITGFGNPQSTVCPASGIDLGYMESFQTLTITATGDFGSDGQNIGVLADLDATEDCLTITDSLLNQTCQMTLDKQCTLIYEVTSGDAGDATSGSSAGQKVSGRNPATGTSLAVSRNVAAAAAAGRPSRNSTAAGPAVSGAGVGMNVSINDIAWLALMCAAGLVAVW